jgi:hypothetical protein
MIRIQLANNFQVVELTAENLNDINKQELKQAIELVNRLAVEVLNAPKKTRGGASEKQINYAISLGLDRATAEGMTQKELWQYINENKE